MLRVLIASHHFPPHYVAGAEQYAYRLARWLVHQGHEAEVVCVESIDYGDSPEPICTEDHYDGIAVHRLQFNLGTVSDPFRWSYWNPAIGEWLGEFLADRDFDLVHVNSSYLLSVSPIETAKDLGLPVVLTLHDYWFLCPRISLLHPDGTLCQGPESAMHCAWCRMTEQRRYRLLDVTTQRKLGSAVMRWSRRATMRRLLGLDRWLPAMRDRRATVNHALQRVDTVVSLSRFLSDKHAEYGLRPRRVVSIGFGMDPLRFPSQIGPRIHMDAAGRPDLGLRIGYLGQLAPHKGIETLVRAFNWLRTRPPHENGQRLRLEVHGGFGHHVKYERRIRRLAAGNPAIQFFGRYENHRVGEILSGLDAIVVPSVWYENRPTVILEALAARTPVIGSAIGGIPELVNHKINGLLFEPGDSLDLAKQIRCLLDEPSLLSRLHDNIGPVKTVEQEMAELMQVYESV